MSIILPYQGINQQLKQANIDVSATELHGFLCGLICGNVAKQNWLNLVYQFTNDGMAYPIELVKNIELMYKETNQQLSNIETFSFYPFFPEQETIFARAESLSNWANNFLLGIGIAQPNIVNERGDIEEALQDLQDICLLSCDEEEEQILLTQALDELIEYIRTIAYLFYKHYHLQPKTTLH